MKVVFDARVLDRPALAERGVGRYARCLLDALGDRVTPLRDARRPPSPERVAELWEHVLQSRDTRKADVLHSPSVDNVSLRPGAALVVTLHDLFPLERPDRYLRTGFKHRLRYTAVRRAAAVIVPSRSVAASAARLLGVEAVVVPEAPAPAFRPSPGSLEREDLPPRYLLWVGGLDPPDPRKNVEQLAQAVAAGDGPPLVLAGRPGPEAQQLEAPGRVFLAGRVSDAELAALYSGADALVIPSDDEGFGLPAAEAMACGTPVVAFAAGALAEHEGVELVEPGDFPALLAAAERVTGTPVRVPRRTWAQVADETWAVYERVAPRG